ncbi:MAG TPA: hypothetical protein VIU11_10500 [Nakamurella sp.]
MTNSSAGWWTSSGRQWSILTGYAALLCGVVAALLDKPWPADAAALPAFLAENRAAILWQAMLFLVGAAFFMWFLGCLRSDLVRVEADRGRLTMVAFVAGYGVTVLALAPQIALILPIAPGWNRRPRRWRPIWATSC